MADDLSDGAVDALIDVIEKNLDDVETDAAGAGVPDR